MTDLLMILIAITFFLLMWGMIALCDSLMES